MKKWIEAFDKLKAEVTEKSLTICSGNKKYVFEESVLPSRIEIDGVNILSKPIALNMEFAQGDSRFEEIYYRIAEKSEEKIVAIVGANCGNVVINLTVTAEIDGFVKLDMKFSSFWMFSEEGKKTPKLNKMNMTVSVKEKYSSLFHYWPNDRQSILPAADVINSGKTEDFEFMFKPYVWTGNNREGLGIYFGETFEPFQLEDEDKCIVVCKNNENTTITLNMLDSMPINWQGRDDHWCETLKPKMFTIGFQATPVNKKNTLAYDEYYKRVHITEEPFYNEENIEYFAKKGVKWVIIHEDWSAIQNYGMPDDEEKFKKMVKKYHKKGIKVMPYFGYEYSTLMPDFTEKCDDYLVKTVKGNFTGGWQRKPAQRAFMACYKGGYAKVMQERVKYAFDILGVDGIYTDSTYVPWECANTSHGCGYTDKDGNSHTTYPFMAVRNHVKELYRIVHERGGIIDTHNSSCCIMPLLSFADSCYDGENIQGAFRKGGLEFLSLDAFRAEFMGINYGFIPNFIAYVAENFSLEKISALTLLHNVHSRPGNLHNSDIKKETIEYAAMVWSIFDKYDLDENQWIPYFENNEVTTTEDKVYISLYKDKKETVAIVSSFVGKEVTIVAKGYKKAVNIVNKFEYEINDEKVIVDVKPNSPEFFIFK